MPYNQALDDRLNAAIADWGTTRKKMFGGTCDLVNGNMACGVYKDYLILRLGEEEARAALARPGVRPMDITGRAMKGWVMVDQAGLTDAAMAQWLARARCYAESLPAK